ncbi:sulfite reductase [Methyloceanibacter superfactus]|jgi:sulfite reductase (NADPH) hemoprotein beta-component|uniref:Sulfite reductase n=1 Tax=Methyloceanibacter superfactus TaxID=1774969 RepID=A0A1E3W4I2_9HYPH|nr:nitrite/sulfite reductase [Methyloceanibacter superfactus]ODS00412.1 sulfite reductase [Methyloceanibacter superfactus]
MYRYDEFDHAFVRDRVAEFKDQVERRLSGALNEEEFRPLRLRNGLYLQLHAYMLRIAIPYGVLSSRQLRQLAMIARTWDRGYGHFTTRQNLQLNWVKLVDIPDVLAALADVEMHCIQTSGNCVRNVTADPYAAAAVDELEDPRPWCEILRQWSTLHPEFSWLPRKFKIAISGAAEDRAATAFHDIGLRIVKGPNGENGFRVLVGGGMGRIPYVGQEIRSFLPKEHLLSYIESILRVYNLFGRRDNIHKARIKILVNALGIDKFREEVEADWEATHKSAVDLPEDEKRRIMSYFAPPDLPPRPARDEAVAARRASDPAFANWYKHNVLAHRVPGYASVVISLKEPGRTPGDASSDAMDLVADLTERFGHDEVRVNYTQNLVLPHVAIADVPALYDALVPADLATGNNELLGDMICCPGLDYCNLANARSIPIAKEIAKRFEDPSRQEEIGQLRLNMSGCINACGHHHSGNIGILGVDKKGTELYQITLGGNPKDSASVGTIIGPGFRAEAVPQAIDTIVDTYIENRDEGESFLETWRRVGAAPFKEALYGAR